MKTTIWIIGIVLALVVNSLLLEVAVKIVTKKWMSIIQLLTYYGATIVLGAIAYFILRLFSIEEATGIAALIVQAKALDIILDEVNTWKSTVIVLLVNALALGLAYVAFMIMGATF